MKEIIYPEPKPNTDKKCPRCGGQLRWGTIPCPERKPGCLVMHYGYACESCGRIFEEDNTT